MDEQRTAPCKGCEKRKEACHMTCKAYLLYSHSRKETLRKRAESKNLDAMLHNKITRKKNR